MLRDTCDVDTYIRAHLNCYNLNCRVQCQAGWGLERAPFSLAARAPSPSPWLPQITASAMPSMQPYTLICLHTLTQVSFFALHAELCEGFDMMSF